MRKDEVKGLGTHVVNNQYTVTEGVIPIASCEKETTMAKCVISHRFSRKWRAFMSFFLHCRLTSSLRSLMSSRETQRCSSGMSAVKIRTKTLSWALKGQLVSAKRWNEPELLGTESVWWHFELANTGGECETDLCYSLVLMSVQMWFTFTYILMRTKLGLHLPHYLLLFT